jgi:hypothetical protein
MVSISAGLLIGRSRSTSRDHYRSTSEIDAQAVCSLHHLHAEHLSSGLRTLELLSTKLPFWRMFGLNSQYTHHVMLAAAS